MKKIAVLLVLVFIASCSHVPQEKSYPFSYQGKMQASEHWQVLAEKIAGPVKLAAGEKSAIFISDTDQSTFGQAMRTFLKTELQNQGMVPTSDPNSPYAIDWDVQKVFHQANRTNDGSLPFALLTVLQAIFVGGVGQDYIKPHTEIIISYDLYKKESNLWGSILRDTQIFYINDVDRDHYLRYAESRVRLRPVQYNIVNR